eukprot:scaffold43200_cov53-Attheya_sp.AAC.2
MPMCVGVFVLLDIVYILSRMGNLWAPELLDTTPSSIGQAIPNSQEAHTVVVTTPSASKEDCNYPQGLSLSFYYNFVSR